MSETGRYRNYEGADWDLLMVADDIETGVPFAVYRDAGGSRTWIRPLEEFTILATKIDGPPAGESVDALLADIERRGWDYHLVSVISSTWHRAVLYTRPPAVSHLGTCDADTPAVALRAALDAAIATTERDQ